MLVNELEIATDCLNTSFAICTGITDKDSQTTSDVQRFGRQAKWYLVAWVEVIEK
jgi:hypothetical protein